MRYFVLLIELIKASIAGVFVFATLLVTIEFSLKYHLFDSFPAPLVGIVLGVGLILLIFAAFVLFNSIFAWLRLPVRHRQSIEETLETLRNSNLLLSTDYHAIRAFEVAEFEDEGTHYFIELEDNRILFLSGQYLYQYDPICDDPEHNKPRLFPCTDFTIHRHKRAGYVVKIETGGDVLFPEVKTPPFMGMSWEQAPLDGKIITGTSYDSLKEHLMNQNNPFSD